MGDSTTSTSTLPAFPAPTKTFHHASYPAISPLLSNLSAAGKRVLVTGGGSGIGPSIARAFALAGSTKIAILGRTLATLEETKQSILSTHPGVDAIVLTADVADETAVNAALECVRSEWGGLDVLVANAGYLPTPSPLASSSLTDWWKAFEVNVRGSFILTQAFLASLDSASQDPVLISVNTGAAHIPAGMVAGASGYAASKLATAKAMEYVAAENPKVRVISVHPGVVETAMNVKSGVKGNMDDVNLPAHWMVWAASPEAAFLNGKFVWANWDVEGLKAKKEEITGESFLTVTLGGWPFS